MLEAVPVRMRIDLRQLKFSTVSGPVQCVRGSGAGADVLISNHTIYDGSKTKLPAVQKRKLGDPNPYVIGNDSVQRYLTVADECAKAGLLRLK